MKLSASIVLYKTDLTPLKKVIDSYFACKSEALQLFLVDNSPTDTLKDVVTMYPDKEIHYIFNNENMGYGKAHNIAIKKSMEQGLPYHIVLNPDIVIQEGALEKRGRQYNAKNHLSRWSIAIPLQTPPLPYRPHF